ncbi:MAG: tRNA (adenine(22)-N(1))-methyltransferase [Bacillota bacterium]
MISKRLKVASEYLKGFNYLADCGTDHGKLPIFAVEKKYVKKAIASDNKNKPLIQAKQNIAKKGLIGKVNAVFAEGLSYLYVEKDVDVVSVLGLGGRTIVDILNNADLINVKRLVLSANSQNYQLRSFLENNRWNIISEAFIKENDKYYQIIVAEKGRMQLTELEREFGPFILKEKNNVFKERISKMLKQLKIAKEKASNENTKNKLIDRIKFLEEAIS